jgi:L-seryl-tRNA(Ser) seleniumtransferase
LRRREAPPAHSTGDRFVRGAQKHLDRRPYAGEVTDPRRALPAVDRVVGDLDGLPRALLVQCAREALDAARDGAADAPLAPADVVADARRRVEVLRAGLLRPLVNATGVLLHTNLGRAPLGDAALGAAARVARGYSNLEYDLEAGQRGSRHAHAGMLLARACGAEAGIVVNNNAAAVLLALGALARGREVPVSRGELVEIGGGFRVPEIMAESGARLVEVGTTNRTRRADYEAALGASTALFLKVHASNYRMVGFTESTPVRDLAGLGPPVMVDVGSGLLDETTPWLTRRPEWLHDEPGVRQAFEAGAALVTCSGDKLLGGPQAGVVLGRADLVATIARHPLARAVRADKVTLAALQDVAFAYLDRDGARIPLWRLATTPLEHLRTRAEAIAGRVPAAKVVDTDAVAGGGSLPGLTIPSVGVALEVAAPDTVLGRLRGQDIVARVMDDAVVCDLRTVEPADDELVARALGAAGATR